jgi:hypothetical protein
MRHDSSLPEVTEITGLCGSRREHCSCRCHESSSFSRICPFCDRPQVPPRGGIESHKLRNEYVTLQRHVTFRNVPPTSP